MDDTQPNEVRLSRKGSTNIPRVRTTRPVHTPYSTSKRPRWQPPPTRAPFPSSTTNRHELLIHHPPECHKRAPGSHSARKRWIKDQKYHQAPPLVKDTHSDLAQSSEPGPSRIRPASCTFPGLGGCPQRLDNRSPIPSSGLSVERKPIELSTTAPKSRPVEIVHTDTVPRPRAAVLYAPSAESVIDLTLDCHDPVAEEHIARWSTFQSGRLPISLPPLSSGSRILSPEASTDQALAQIMGQREDMPVVSSSVTNFHSAHQIIWVNDTVPTRSMEDHRVRGSLSDHLSQHDVSEVVHSSCPRSMVLDDEAEVPPLPSGCNSLIRAFTPACGNLPLPLGPHDKPRRILHDHDSAYIVTAHGIIDQVGTTSVLKLDHNVRSPSLPYEEFVEDTCILSRQGDPVIILGHAREQEQISLLNLGHGQVSRHITLHRDWNTTKRPGVSAMTSLMSPLKFASGGYDHRVHLWDIAQDLSGASAVELAIKHASHINSLLPILDTSHKLVSVGADRDIPIYDLSAERVVQTLETSCTPYHAHKTDSRSCILLEVSHLETQFEIRDHRMPYQAVQRFGFLAEERRGRYEKADSWSHFVACGDKNGVVHLWDLRNVSTEIALRQCFNDPVVQVVNTGPHLLACSKRNELACIDL